MWLTSILFHGHTFQKKIWFSIPQRSVSVYIWYLWLAVAQNKPYILYITIY